MVMKECNSVAVGSTNRRVSEWCNPALASPPKHIGGYVDRGPSSIGSLPIGAAEIVAARIKPRDNLKWEKCLSHI